MVGGPVAVVGEAGDGAGEVAPDVVVAAGGSAVADVCWAAVGVWGEVIDVAFGGLRGQLTYDDAAFDIDPDIQEMFYGDAAPR